MRYNGKPTGFSLIELLLVLVIIGVISGIAIPAFMGQRARARSIGDAQANSQVFRMQLETYKADNGVYGADGTAYVWTGAIHGVAGSANAALAALLPTFAPGGSAMNLTMQTNGGGLAFKIKVNDPTLTGTPIIYMTDQTGANLPVTTAFP
jgi:prepilin-type N-terminal cleavage/methylation domain-containing protein